MINYFWFIIFILVILQYLFFLFSYCFRFMSMWISVVLHTYIHTYIIFFSFFFSCLFPLTFLLFIRFVFPSCLLHVCAPFLHLLSLFFVNYKDRNKPCCPLYFLNFNQLNTEISYCFYWPGQKKNIKCILGCLIDIVLFCLRRNPSLRSREPSGATSDRHMIILWCRRTGFEFALLPECGQLPWKVQMLQFWSCYHSTV